MNRDEILAHILFEILELILLINRPDRNKLLNSYLKWGKQELLDTSIITSDKGY